MNTVPGAPSHLTAGIIKRVVAVAGFLVAMMAILFLAAGQPDWLWAWVYLGLLLASIAVVGPLTFRTNLETVAERGELRITRDWDKVLSVLYALAFYVALPLVAGLDVRFAWSGAVSLASHVAGGVVLAAGLGLYGWAMIANAYFSTAVRIQDERGQRVVSSGPYWFVRHPGYVGLILEAIGVPLLLGSWWALIPGVAGAVCMAIRTSFEDRMLRAELPGYQDYAQRVRYRLVPGIW